MAFTLQRFRDLLGNPYAVIGVCVAVSVTAYFTLSSHHLTVSKEKASHEQLSGPHKQHNYHGKVSHTRLILQVERQGHD